MDDRILLPNPKCQSFKWYLEVKPTTDEPGMTVYYWIVQATAEPRLAALELSPQVVILNQDQHMTATVRLKDETWPWHPECYQVTAAVSSGQIMTTTMVQQPAPFVFPFTLPPDLRWGPITVTADLAYVNKPDNKVDWRSATVQIKYLPEFPNGLTLEAIPDPGTLQKQTGEFTVSIPVPYAAVVPGLQVHFSLYPESFDAGSEKPPKSRDGCAQTNMGQAEQLAHFTSRRDEKNPNALIFDVVFPYQQLMEPKCDYYHLLIRWTDLTGDGDEAWDQIQMIKEPLPPTPAPNPTRGLIGPSILCPAVVVTLGIIAPGFWLLKRRSGARSKDSHVRKGKVQNGNSGSHIPEK
jgi:hypothetical protein